MIITAVGLLFPLLGILMSTEDSVTMSATHLDCVRASDQCLKEPGCSSKYRTMRQCMVGKEGNISAEARDECRNALDALKQSPLYNCRCKRGMKKEKNCLRIYWGIYQHLQGNDLLEDSPYEPVTSRLSDIFQLAPIYSGDPALARENNCLNAAKACNLNDTCKKYRSAYITPCTSRVSTAEVCNKRKCHKALRQFFDKVPPKHSYSMLYCNCPPGDQSACSERRRQTIVPACSYVEKERPNCLELQAICKSNYICRSRLADFFANCQPEPRSLSGCLKENYADCLLSYSGLIGTVMTPNYLRSPIISVSPFCDCTNSGNSKEECDRFTKLFIDNACLRNAVQAFGNGTDVSMRQSAPSVQSTTTIKTPSHRAQGHNRLPSALGPDTDSNPLNPGDNSLYQFCGNLQAQKLKSNHSIDVLCVDPQIDKSSTSNSITGNMASPLSFSSTLLLLLASLHSSLAFMSDVMTLLL